MAACAFAIAESIMATGRNLGGRTFVLGIKSFGLIRAGSTAVAGFAHGTFGLGIIVKTVERANPHQVGLVTSLAFSTADDIAAHTVGTDTEHTFGAVTTGLAESLLGHTDIAEAIVRPDALTIISTTFGTGGTSHLAPIG
jgi:hypothetical protein